MKLEKNTIQDDKALFLGCVRIHFGYSVYEKLLKNKK